MNIMIYDVAAESGGATTILNYFYNIHKEDKENYYYYILSIYHLDETDNITVINVPEVKNGWLSRLKFDYFGVQKYLKEFHIDEVFSLQNTIIPCFKGKQTVYLHNALPFAEYRYRLSEDRVMWIYQNIIGRFMLDGIKKANHVIVQTEWMKNAITQRIKGADRKTEIMFPKVEIPDGYQYIPQEKCTFFYPANSADFKNHRVIIKAAMLLKKQGITDYSIVFTLNGNEKPAIKSIYEKSKSEELNIQWIGILPRKEVFEWYSKSVLLFPSYIETVGLPIYEALSVGCPAIVADCAYARNIADGFENVRYFKYEDEKTLAEFMKQEIDNFVKCDSYLSKDNTYRRNGVQEFSYEYKK